MSYLFILLSFLFIGQPSDPPPQNLSITVTGEVELPADRVQFSININAEADSPQAAYALHQKREKALVDLVDKYDIKEKDIRYEPVSIRKENRSRGSEKYDTTYVTSQRVNLTLADFDVFEKMQIGLIQHDFDNFSANFSSSRMEEGQDKALKAALDKAQDKAALIAKEAGIKLGAIGSIRYGADNRPSPVNAYTVQMKVSSDSMLKYDQTVTVSATISLTYPILDQPGGQ